MIVIEVNIGNLVTLLQHMQNDPDDPRLRECLRVWLEYLKKEDQQKIIIHQAMADVQKQLRNGDPCCAACDGDR